MGPPLRQLLRGHRTLSAIALGIAIALAGSGALALRFAAERDPLRRLLIVERPAPPQAARLDTRELYRLVKGSAGPSVPGMVRIPGGTFQMGSPPKEKDRDKDETQHWVTVRGFYLAPAEVTQAEYRRVTGKSPSSDKTCGDSCPVETVTWLDAATYCNALSQQEKLEPCYLIDGDKVEWPDPEGCKGYRLPTEAEWEWAARGGCAGMEERYVGTDEETKVCEQDNVADESSGLPNKFPCNDKQPRLSAVRQFKPNRFQLFDMGGNVLEWVWDWYQPDYEKLTSANPTGPTTGQDRVYRGGSWDSYPGNARVAGRIRSAPSNRDDDLGFRVARSLP